MKEWWQQLALREKRMVAGGAIVVAVLLIYFGLWFPLQHTVSSLRQTIVKNQNLLAWMQQADAQMKTIVPTKTVAVTSMSPAALLGWLQNSIQQAGLDHQLTQIKEGSDEAILLQFQAVNFDALINWLAQAQEQQGFRVTQMSAVKTAASGMVNAEITLSSISQSEPRA